MSEETGVLLACVAMMGIAALADGSVRKHRLALARIHNERTDVEETASTDESEQGKGDFLGPVVLSGDCQCCACRKAAADHKHDQSGLKPDGQLP